MSEKTYGQIRLMTGPIVDKHVVPSHLRGWHLQLDSHVMVKFKRVFERVQKAQITTVVVADTPDNAHELLWFFTLYPVQMDGLARARLAAQDLSFRERKARVESILLHPNDLKLEYVMNLPPRDYQKLPAALVLETGRLLCADQLGTGKTVSAITLLANSATLPALVVTLAGSMPDQWRAELNRFVPNLRVHVLKKGRPYRLDEGRGGKKIGMPDVIVCNYHKIGHWAQTLGDYVRTVIWDECQELRAGAEDNDTSITHKYAAARHLAKAATYRLGLSATPIYNLGGEIYYVMQCIAPGELGDRHEFVREHLSGEALRDPDAFGAYLKDSGLMIRRTMQDVGRELPPLINVPMETEADPNKLNEIAGKAVELARKLLESRDAFTKMKAAEELSNALRQATGVAKAPHVADFVHGLLEQGHRVVLYGWHRLVYDIWLERLAAWRPVMFTGTESATQKKESRAAFMEGKANLLVMSLRAGAGVDGFQHNCSVVVFGELDWAAGIHAQAAGRVHRDGQTEPVTAYYMIAKIGSDPTVADVLGVKKAQLDGILTPGESEDHVLAIKSRGMSQLARDFLEQMQGRRAPNKSIERAVAEALPPINGFGQQGFWKG